MKYMQLDGAKRVERIGASAGSGGPPGILNEEDEVAVADASG
jgi:hypothetical protein